MLRFDIGKYMYCASPDRNYYLVCSNTQALESGTVDNIQSYDHVMHQSLDKIFSEHCHNDRDQIKEFLRGPQHNTDQESIIEPILEQEPILSGHFSREELCKLSLLWIAVLGCYKMSAELLVRSGADVNELFGRRDPQPIDEKWTVLHLLLQLYPFTENERLIRLVIEHGADLQAKDYTGRTVMHHAVRQGRVQIIELLLEKGADVNAADNSGVSPLLVAIRHVKANELVPLLMKHGADVFAKDIHGHNAWYYLTCSPVRNHIELTRVLIEKGVSIKDNRNYSRLIHPAIILGKSELVKLFLDYGANVNEQQEGGKFPLYFAALRHNATVLGTLLKYGANINLRTIYGRTALHAACQNEVTSMGFFDEDNKLESIIKLLLSAGADVLVEDCKGKTPFALMSSSDNVKEPETRLMIKVLALTKILQPSVELKDERIIERFSKMRSYYRECVKEIDRMKSTNFIETCTFFELFTKSQCQIALLMQNPEFESKFRLYDLNGFSIYAEHLLQAFERAQNHYHAMLEQENVINEAVYYVLPYLVVKRIVRYIFDGCCSDIT